MRPVANLVPVAQVAGGDAREREVERLGDDRAAEEPDRHRLDSRHVRERAVELRPRLLPLLRLVGGRPEGEGRERLRRELRAKAPEERARVSMPAPHVERCAEHGANIVSYGGMVDDQLAKNWYTAELGDVKDLRALLTALRNIEAVFDAYRVTPS